MNDLVAGHYEREFAATSISALHARNFVAEMLRFHEAPETVVSDYVLVTSELATSHIEHRDGTHLTVSVDVNDPDWWELKVGIGTNWTALTPLLLPAAWSDASSLRTSDRGLCVVRHLMDDVVVELQAGQIVTRCRLSRVPLRL